MPLTVAIAPAENPRMLWSAERGRPVSDADESFAAYTRFGGFVLMAVPAAALAVVVIAAAVAVVDVRVHVFDDVMIYVAVGSAFYAPLCCALADAANPRARRWQFQEETIAQIAHVMGRAWRTRTRVVVTLLLLSAAYIAAVIVRSCMITRGLHSTDAGLALTRVFEPGIGVVIASCLSLLVLLGGLPFLAIPQETR